MHRGHFWPIYVTILHPTQWPRRKHTGENLGFSLWLCHFLAVILLGLTGLICKMRGGTDGSWVSSFKLHSGSWNILMTADRICVIISICWLRDVMHRVGMCWAIYQILPSSWQRIGLASIHVWGCLSLLCFLSSWWGNKGKSLQNVALEVKL